MGTRAKFSFVIRLLRAKSKSLKASCSRSGSMRASPQLLQQFLDAHTPVKHVCLDLCDQGANVALDGFGIGILPSLCKLGRNCSHSRRPKLYIWKAHATHVGVYCHQFDVIGPLLIVKVPPLDWLLHALQRLKSLDTSLSSEGSVHATRDAFVPCNCPPVVS